MTQRDNTFDVMKGIGILAMIIGHCHIPHLISKLIFAWHMPLFYLVSGYFYKQKSKEDYLKQNTRQLLLPYVVTSVVMIILSELEQLVVGKGDVFKMCVSALIGSGSKNNPTFSEYNIGAIWFLLAMFWCRNIYNFIQISKQDPRLKGGAIIVISVIATYIGSMVYVPIDMLEGFGALFLFYIGHLARQFKLFDMKINIWFVVVVLILTVLSIYAGSMSMVRCYYGYWPINNLAAIGVTILIYHISKYLNRNHFLVWCGRVSIVILCVHNIVYLPLRNLREIIGMSASFDVILHLLFALLGTWMVLKFSLLKRLFLVN